MATAPPEAVGPAHVGVVSFLAARAAPTGGFWIALAGGVALARVAERCGARLVFGASAAAMLETVAIIGPARFGVPLTQALSAPMLGRLHARGAGFWPQLLACALVRLLHNAATTAFFIWVIAGGLLAWAAFASTVQVLVYGHGLRMWASTPAVASGQAAPGSEGGTALDRPVDPDRRFDPRAVALAALVAFVLLLASTEWELLAAVALWLVFASLVSRAEPTPLRAGLAFAAILAGGAFVFALGGGLGLDTALRRASRAGLLVLVATWLRAAAGAAGLREVSRRALGRVRRVPSATEAAAILDAIASEGRLAAAGRARAARLWASGRRPRALGGAAPRGVIGGGETVGPAARPAA